MAINLMKRMESSVFSFNLTLGRIKKQIENTINMIDSYENRTETKISLTDISAADEYDLDDQNVDDFSSIGKRVQIDLADMDRLSWRSSLVQDKEILECLTLMIGDITPKHDSKLQELLPTLQIKSKIPLTKAIKRLLFLRHLRIQLCTCTTMFPTLC